MYKALFQNSRIALLFAVMTIMSAVSMVGTSQDKGLLPMIAGLIENQRGAIARDAAAYAEARSGGDQPPAAATSVFGDYAPSGEPAAAAVGPTGSASVAEGAGSAPAGAFNPMTAPMSPTARVLPSGGAEVVGPPYISEREMTITPQ